MKQQCGEAAQALSPIEPDLVKRAREAGAPLALAPLSTWGNYPDGLTVEQQERVRAVLADPDGRTAWLSVNNQRISMMIDKSGVFPDATSSEIHSALVLSLCYFGDDCSAKSLYMIDVCAASLNCGAGAVEDVIFANAPLARQSIVSATALAIALGIQRGDLSGIGLIKSAPTKGK